jgi:hypothetical protein
MKKALLILIAALFFSPAAKAQIGATLEQCKAHYGEASELQLNADGTPKKCRFQNPPNGSTGGEYNIYASFSDGECVSVSYNGIHGITSKQAVALLRLNSNGYIWTRTGSTPKEIDYSAHFDGKVVMQAFYAAGKSQLMIATSEWWQNNQ